MLTHVSVGNARNGKHPSLAKRPKVLLGSYDVGMAST